MERAITKTERIEQLLNLGLPDLPGECVERIELLFQNVPDKRTKLYSDWKFVINTLIGAVNIFHKQPLYKRVK